MITREERYMRALKEQRLQNAASDAKIVSEITKQDPNKDPLEELRK